MTRPGFVEHYPHRFHPLVDVHPWVEDDTGQRVRDKTQTVREPDRTATAVEVFQLRPGDAARLAEWSGVSGYPGADGGVLLVDDGRVVGQVRLGDFVVRDDDGLRVEQAESGFFMRWAPAD